MLIADAPNYFPNWKLIYYYYNKWENTEEFDLLLSKLREKERLKRNQKKETEFRNI